MNHVPRSPILEAIHTRLGDGGLTVGLDDNTGLAVPHVVIRDLYPIDHDGPPTAARNDDVEQLFQLDAVAGHPFGAKQLLEEAEALMTATPLQVAGLSVDLRPQTGGGSDKDTDTDPPRFKKSARWSAWSTPS